MCEVSESSHKPVNSDTVIEETIQGLINVNILSQNDSIVSRWHKRLERGYPTPFLGRDQLLESVLPRLQNLGIFSRGRFGAWKYEVGNQDHSFMQGVEAVNRIVFNYPEQTVFEPSQVNAQKNKFVECAKQGH